MRNANPDNKVVTSIRARLVAVSFLSILCFTAANSVAQDFSADTEYSTTGIIVFPSFSISSWEADEFNIDGESGTGGGIGFGFGISNRIALFANLIGGTIHQADTDDTYSLSHADLGIRGTIGPATSRWKFIAELLVSGVRSENAFPKPKVEVEGRMYSLGAGVQYFVYKSLALQIRLTGGRGTFNQFRLENEEVELNTIDRDFATTRVGFSLVWFAMK
jgi:hypothetical protein